MSKRLYSREYGLRIQDNKLKSIANHFRLKQILKLTNIKKEDKVLEIGANTGELTKKLMQHSDYVVGIDINESSVKISNMSNIILMDASNLKFENNFFDKIITVHTIEHIPDLKKVFIEINKSLKNKGLVVLVYPFDLIRGSTALFDAITVYKNPLVARKLHIHKLNPFKIKKLLNGTNLEVKKSGIYFELYPAFYTVLTKNA